MSSSRVLHFRMLGAAVSVHEARRRHCQPSGSAAIVCYSMGPTCRHSHCAVWQPPFRLRTGWRASSLAVPRGRGSSCRGTSTSCSLPTPSTRASRSPAPPSLPANGGRLIVLQRTNQWAHCIEPHFAKLRNAYVEFVSEGPPPPPPPPLCCTASTAATPPQHNICLQQISRLHRLYYSECAQQKGPAGSAAGMAAS